MTQQCALGTLINSGTGSGCSSPAFFHKCHNYRLAREGRGKQGTGQIQMAAPQNVYAPHQEGSMSRGSWPVPPTLPPGRCRPVSGRSHHAPPGRGDQSGHPQDSPTLAQVPWVPFPGIPRRQGSWLPNPEIDLQPHESHRRSTRAHGLAHAAGRRRTSQSHGTANGSLPLTPPHRGDWNFYSDCDRTTGVSEPHFAFLGPLCNCQTRVQKIPKLHPAPKTCLWGCCEASCSAHGVLP